VLGPLTAVIYYILFRGSILAFNLKTPGRLQSDGTNGSKESLRAIIAALGGRDNIVELNACLTRLRLSVQIVYGTKAETLRKVLQRYLDTRR